MKKAMIMLAVAAVAVGAFARPHGGPGFGGPRRGFVGHRMPPPRYYHHHHHHRSGWGTGGAFLGGFVGGLIGGAVVDAYASPRYRTETVVVQQTPVITQTPVVVQQTPVVVQRQTTAQVWVEGRYIDQVQANGTVVRIWQPGHYEVQTVTY